MSVFFYVKTIKICWRLGATPPDPRFCATLPNPWCATKQRKQWKRKKKCNKHCNVNARKRWYSVHNFIKIYFKNFAIPVVNIQYSYQNPLRNIFLDTALIGILFVAL